MLKQNYYYCKHCNILYAENMNDSLPYPKHFLNGNKVCYSCLNELTELDDNDLIKIYKKSIKES